MVKVIVNKGRKVWDRENRREAKEGEAVEVKPVEAKILKYRGHASDAPPDAPQQPSLQPPAPLVVATPPPAAEALPPQAPAQLSEVPIANEEEQRLRRGTYRRRDLRSEI
jgi:hypothetical protein